MQEMWVPPLCWQDTLEEEMATHPRILAWNILWTKEFSGLQSMGLQRIGHNWVTYTHTYTEYWVEFLVLYSRSLLIIYFIYSSVYMFSSVQFWTLCDRLNSLCPTLCDPMNRSTPGLPVHHQLPEFTQTHIHRVSDAIRPSHPLSSPSPPAPNPSQHQSLFQWVNTSHEVAKVLEFQL